ncbi:MAG: vWA domain-containing protein [Thermoanaerobaculia bacterium]
MTSLFAWPVALAAAAVAIPAIFAIYFLRSRLKTIEVAGLFLWTDAPRTKEGGRRLRRLTTPLLFFLELLALILLTIAAARPFGPRAGDARPLVLVVDDSFSMQAGEDASPRARAIDWLRTGLEGDAVSSVRVVLAGETPTLAGAEAGSLAAARPALDTWSCGSPSGDLEKAIAFALETGGARARVLVITDHAPATPPASGRVVWKSFGDARANAAFIAAARSSSEGGEKLLFEVKNFSSRAASPSLRIGSSTQSRDIPLELGAGEARRVSLTLARSQAAVTATLSGDALAFDNAVTLLDPGRGEIRARVDIADVRLRELVERGLEATGQVSLGGGEPVLVVTDSDVAPRPGRWIVRFDRTPGAVSLAGPFLVDGAHPLTRGLALAGVVWGAPRGPMPGDAIVTAGNTPLVTESESARGAKTITIRFDPALSTLHLTPAWPVLLWNLVEWRASELPGFLEANARVGAIAQLALPPAIDKATIESPDGRKREIDTAGGSATIRLSQPGVWAATTSAGAWRVAANPIAPAESDLSQAATGSWGDWQRDSDPSRAPRDLTWAALIAVLAILTAHLRFAAKGAA